MERVELEKTGRLLILSALLLGLSAICSGCAVLSPGGGELYFGQRRTDTVQQTQTMVDKSWREAVWGKPGAESK